MANRFLVGTGARNWSDGSIWSSTSGGVGADLLGTELITNSNDRDFSSDTGFWTKASGVSISDGVLHVNSVLGEVRLITRNPIITIGHCYKITYTILNYVSGGIRPSDNYSEFVPTRSNNGTYTNYFVALASQITFIAKGTSTTLDIDNISIQEVLTYPTSGDTVYFDNNSGTGILTLNVTANCGSLNSSGLTSGVTITSAVYSLSVYGNLTENGTYSLYNFTGTAYFYFKGTGTITTNGRAAHVWNRWYIDGVGITVSHADDISLGTSGGRDLYLTNGTWTTNNKTITIDSFNTNAGTKTANLGSSIITLYNGICVMNPAGLTFNAGTSTINAIGDWLSGAGVTFYNITWTSTRTIGGTNWGNFTCNNFTIFPWASILNIIPVTANITVNGTLTISGSNATTQRVLIQSNTIGTPRTITCNGTTNISNADFRDITLAGTANRNFSSQVDVGDCGGNSGITFPESVTQYFKHTSGAVSWSNSAKWFTATNGGGSSGRVPLPQDDVYFDSNSLTGTTTLTIDCPRICRNLNMSGTTQTLNLIQNLAISCYGNFILGDKVTQTGSYTTWFSGRGIYFINTFGKYLMYPNFNNAYNGNYTILSGFTYGQWISQVSFCTINLGDNVYTCIANCSCGLFYGGSPINAQSSTLMFTPSVGSTNIGFYGGSRTYNNVWFSGLDSGTFDIYNNNTFNNLKIDAGKKIRVLAGSIQTINSLTATGTAANPITISSTTTGSTFTLTKSQPLNEKIECDYLILKDSNVTPSYTWYTGLNSTNNGNNTGWIYDTFHSRPIITQPNKKIIVDNNGRIVW